jgi:hypothetical protein
LFPPGPSNNTGRRVLIYDLTATPQGQGICTGPEKNSIFAKSTKCHLLHMYLHEQNTRDALLSSLFGSAASRYAHVCCQLSLLYCHHISCHCDMQLRSTNACFTAFERYFLAQLSDQFHFTKVSTRDESTRSTEYPASFARGGATLRRKNYDGGEESAAKPTCSPPHSNMSGVWTLDGNERIEMREG